MRRPLRGLTPGEAALWARVAQTVTPLDGNKVPVPLSVEVAAPGADGGRPVARDLPRKKASSPGGPPPSHGQDRPRLPSERHGLDAGWDRKLSRGIVQPDFTLDLHGSSLDAAHGRLDHGLTLALAQGARVVLLITGRERPSEDRNGRGAIRRKFVDWLKAGPHAGRIAAIRPAHPRHGGAGAVYLVLRRAK